MAEKYPIAGELLNEQIEFSLGELCQSCSVSGETVIEMVTEGIIQPSGTGPDDWRFTGTSLIRVKSVLRLQRDLRVNLPGAALALELLEEIDMLRRELKRRSAR